MLGFVFTLTRPQHNEMQPLINKGETDGIYARVTTACALVDGPPVTSDPTVDLVTFASPEGHAAIGS